MRASHSGASARSLRRYEACGLRRDADVGMQAPPSSTTSAAAAASSVAEVAPSNTEATPAVSPADKARLLALSESRFRWRCIAVVLLCTLWLVLQSARVNSGSGYTGSQQLELAPLQRTPSECMASFSSAASDVTHRQLYWRDSQHTRDLRRALRGKWIHLSGDSTLRDIYYQLIHLLETSPQFGLPVTDSQLAAHRYSIRHKSQSHEMRDDDRPDEGRSSAADSASASVSASLRVSFAWSPFLRNVTTDVSRTLGVNDGDGVPYAHTAPNVVLLSAGLWNALYDSEQAAESRQVDLDAMGRDLALHLLRNHWRLQPDVRRQRMQMALSGASQGDATTQPPPSSVDADRDLLPLAVPGKGYADWQTAARPTLVWLSSPTLLDSRLTQHRLANPRFRNAQVERINTIVQDKIVARLPMLLGDTHRLSSGRAETANDDGVHSLWAAARTAEAIASFLQCSYSTSELVIG